MAPAFTMGLCGLSAAQQSRQSVPFIESAHMERGQTAAETHNTQTHMHARCLYMLVCTFRIYVHTVGARTCSLTADYIQEKSPPQPITF